MYGANPARSAVLGVSQAASSVAGKCGGSASTPSARRSRVSGPRKGVCNLGSETRANLEGQPEQPFPVRSPPATVKFQQEAPLLSWEGLMFRRVMGSLFVWPGVLAGLRRCSGRGKGLMVVTLGAVCAVGWSPSVAVADGPGVDGCPAVAYQPVLPALSGGDAVQPGDVLSGELPGLPSGLMFGPAVWLKDGVVSSLPLLNITAADHGAVIQRAAAWVRPAVGECQLVFGVAFSPPVRVVPAPVVTQSPEPAGWDAASGRVEDGPVDTARVSPPAPAPTLPAGGGPGDVGSVESPVTAGSPVTVSVKARAVKARVSTKSKAKVRLSVATADGSAPEGTVVVSWGGLSKTVALKTGANGKLTVSLPRLAKGSYKVSAVFFDTSGKLATSKAKDISLRVLG